MRFTSLLLVFFSITCFAARRKFNEDEQPARSKRRRISPVLTPDQLILQEIHDTNPPILLKEHYQNSGLRDAKNTLENMGYWEVELPNVSVVPYSGSVKMTMKCESETFELRKCVSATMSYKKREIYLDRVDGAPFGCPSAAITLKYAEGFAKSFGAIIVKLFDASSYWLFRSIPEEIEPNIIVYAKLFTGLKNGIVEPYYQKHGYSFLSATFNETVQQSVDLIGSLTTNELRNSLSRCEVCVQANEALSNFDGVFREVFQDLHIVAESGDIEAQITLYQIFMIFVSYDAFKNFKQGSNVRTAVKNIVSSECEVEDAHYMIKRLDV